VEPQNPFVFDPERGIFVPNIREDPGGLEEPEPPQLPVPPRKQQPSAPGIGVMLVISVLVIVAAKIIYPSVFPFPIFSLWKTNGNVAQWFIAGLPLMLWTLVLNLFLLFVVRRSAEKYNPLLRLQPMPPSQLVREQGVFFGGVAGIMEEIVFRWLWFLHLIPVAKIMNFLFFGFAGVGIPERLQQYVTGPLVNILTLGKLHDYLFHSSGWAVGAAMLMSNTLFKDGHRYQGPIGTLNAWIGGMYFFWLTFHYGLPAAMLVHVACNTTSFYVLAYFLEKRERQE